MFKKLKNKSMGKRKITSKLILSSATILCSLCGVNANVVVAQSRRSSKASDTNDQNYCTKAITQKEYDDYVNFVRNAIAAKFNSITSIANKHQAWIKKIVGTFLANVENYDPTKDPDGDGATLWTPEKILQAKYDYVKTQAIDLGVSSMDYETTRNNYLQDTINNEANDINDPQLMKIFSEAITSATDVAKAQYLDSYGYTLQTIFELTKLGWTPSDSTDPHLDKVLQAAYQEWQRILQNRMQPLEDTSNFTKYVRGYSSEGHYDVGDEINTSDLSSLFSYQYEYSSFGVDFSKYVPDDIDSWRATKPGDYDEAIMSNLYVTKPFDGFYSEDSQVSYQQGEILPGITLHVKIKSLDTDSDSHTCTMAVEYGISHTNSNQILWFDTENNGTKSTPYDTATLSQANTLSLKITSMDQMKYIAAHRWYSLPDGTPVVYDLGKGVVKDDKVDDVNDHDRFTFNDNFHDSGVVVFGEDDWKERPYLDEILEKYTLPSTPDNRYDFQNHPVFITLATTYFGNDPTTTAKLLGDYYGIPAPQNLSNFTNFGKGSNTNFGTIFHKHQQLALKISDINTNASCNYITLNWCVIDSTNDEDQTVDNASIKTSDGYKDVYDIPWLVPNWVSKTPDGKDTTLHDTINLYYHINPTTATFIDYGTSIAVTIGDFADTMSVWVDKFNKIDFGKAKKYFDINDGFDVGTTMLSCVAAVTSFINAVAVLATKGKNGLLIMKMVFAGAVAVLSVWADVFQIEQANYGGLNPYFKPHRIEGDKNTFGIMKKFRGSITVDDKVLFITLNNIISSESAILQDPHATYSAKKQAALDISKEMKNYFPSGDQTNNNRKIFDNIIRTHYQVVMSRHAPNEFDDKVKAITEDEYVKQLNDMLFDNVPIIDMDTKFDEKTANAIMSQMAMFQYIASDYTTSLAKFIGVVTDRYTYYCQNNMIPFIKTHQLTYQWSQLVDWSNAKRISSNVKNLFYLVRDISNNYAEQFNPNSDWTDMRSLMDLYIGILGKLYPESNVKFIVTFVFAKGTDTFFKFEKMFKTWRTWRATLNDENKIIINWGFIDNILQITRCITTAISTLAYVVQAIIDMCPNFDAF